MDRIERAHRTLGIPDGASKSEVHEAYEELKSVWDPRRFDDDPELAERARLKIEKIEEAYQLLSRQTHMVASPPPHPWLEEQEKKREARARKRSGRERRPQADKGRPHSLFDDAFSERLIEPKSRIPLWLIAAAILFGLVLVGVLFIDAETEAPEDRGQVQTRTEAVQNGSFDQPEAPQETVKEAPPEEQISSSEESTSGEVSSQESSSPGHNQPDRPQAREEASQAQSIPLSPSDTPEKKENTSASSQERPRLVRGEPPEEQSSPDQPAEPTPSRGEDEGVRGPEAEEAFLVLRQESQAARELLSDQVPRFRYLEWKALPKDSREFWVDLTAEVIASGEHIHFIWAVNAGERRVRPMSQAARDLELGRTQM